MEQPEHFSEKLLARRWRLSHRTLERWRREGLGPSYLKIGGRILYQRGDVVAYEQLSRRMVAIMPKMQPIPVMSLPNSGRLPDALSRATA